MAYPTQHLLVAWGGTLAGGAEQWVNSIRLRAQPGVAYPTHGVIADNLPTTIRDSVLGFWDNMVPVTSSSTSLVWVKANTIGTDGKYTDDETNVYTFDTPIPGSGLKVPTEVSLCITTQTDKTRGYAHAGRFFHPTFSDTIGTDGRYTVGTASAVAGWAATFMSDLNNSIEYLTVDLMKVHVFSRVGLGASNQITSIRVGRTPDVQRSRRNKIKEDYQSHAV